jgi:hypothetical protein
VKDINSINNIDEQQLSGLMKELKSNTNNSFDALFIYNIKDSDSFHDIMKLWGRGDICGKDHIGYPRALSLEQDGTQGWEEQFKYSITTNDQILRQAEVFYIKWKKMYSLDYNTLLDGKNNNLNQFTLYDTN